MNEINIQGKECSILKIFSNEFIFTIPNFQRPYAWTTEQARELLEDLLTFMGDGNETIETLVPYFLGSIVLIKDNNKPDAKVVDGQQRLTTLTILLSVLRSLVSLADAEGLTTVLYQKGIPIAGIANSYRLTLRERDNPFFQNYIQLEGGITKLKILEEKLSESQKNIRDNALYFLRHLENISEEQRVRLAKFIITRCFLIVVSTPDLDSAYRIFSVLNDRGLDLSHTDILKAEVIGKLPSQQQDIYTAKWEEIEAELGREMFQNLFAYIRTIYRRIKLQDTILKELREYVRPANNPQNFIDNVLKPYAYAFEIIKDKDYQSSKGAEQINNLLEWLNRVNNSDWLPPAILYLSKNLNRPDLLAQFFTGLERLAVGLMILRANVNKRIERYSRLLAYIENDDNLFVAASPLELTSEEKSKILATLDGELYPLWDIRLYVLLRLDAAFAGPGASYQYPIISVEHVLPQSPRPDSIWMKSFPDEKIRNNYVHRLGNLVLLSSRKNSMAQNFDFDKKKQVYFSPKAGVAPFVLTTKVVHDTEWTPAVIERRQQELMSKLKDIWRL